ncbi:hypothetical protein CR492_17400 [Methylocella silvestris]|uniref:Uncharacterized protein n=1 Tax=Methylocella silvestris TaxID=199596 RepID=A0A2J7TD63_METSI|nr:hypothetical protein CR492_17400 [Methylocella silvestris]
MTGLKKKRHYPHVSICKTGLLAGPAGIAAMASSVLQRGESRPGVGGARKGLGPVFATANPTPSGDASMRKA